ncbi:MAG: GNAT family N-acetyltransferase [Puniceicoccales bacterium]|jgi:RimJ/RimL family protein N-acetyltransferase|nr:GNAT family N-acetyltransferase [Puniceicoccales bacterium]
MFLTGLEKALPVETERLRLRPLVEDDEVEIARYLNDLEVAKGLTYSPYPYTLEMAAQWLQEVAFASQRDQVRYWAITPREGGNFLGILGFSLCRTHDKAEMHYWLGRPFWNRGYTTEAALAMIPFIFTQEATLQRLEINYRTCNSASGRVIEKCGFVFEGELRAYVKRFGHYDDVRFYSLLRREVMKEDLRLRREVSHSENRQA